jgi:chromosome segregation ATPase
MVSHIFLCFPFIPFTLTILDILFTDDMNTSPGVASTDAGEKSATKRARIENVDDVMTVAFPQRKPAKVKAAETKVCSADKEVTAAKEEVETAEEEVEEVEEEVDRDEKKVDTAEEEVAAAKNKVHKAEKKVRKAEKKVAAAMDATAKAEAKMNLAKAERDFAKADLEWAQANVKLAKVAKYPNDDIEELMGIVARNKPILESAQNLYDKFVKAFPSVAGDAQPSTTSMSSEGMLTFMCMYLLFSVFSILF